MDDSSNLACTTLLSSALVAANAGEGDENAGPHAAKGDDMPVLIGLGVMQSQALPCVDDPSAEDPSHFIEVRVLLPVECDSTVSEVCHGQPQSLHSTVHAPEGRCDVQRSSLDLNNGCVSAQILHEDGTYVHIDASSGCMDESIAQSRDSGGQHSVCGDPVGGSEEAAPTRPPAWMESRDGSLLRIDGMDFYALLGVAPESDNAELRNAFREQALIWHPDKAGPQATERFQALGEAYAALTDPEKRMIYDALITHFPPLRPTAAELHPTGFKDVDHFRASHSDLRVASTFLHLKRIWVPKVIGDISWQRPSCDPRRVRVVFSASYPGTAQECDSLTARNGVLDAMRGHLTQLIHVGGWQSDDDVLSCDGTGDSGVSSEASPVDHNQQVLMNLVVARCYLLGVCDSQDFHARMNVSIGLFAARFAIEAFPDDFKVFFAHAHAFAARSSWMSNRCVFM